MGLINLKTPTELPYQWYDLIKTSRTRPSPFKVIEIAPNKIIRQWIRKVHEEMHDAPIQKQREIMVTKEYPRVVSHRQNYNGLWKKTSILNKNQKIESSNKSLLLEFFYKTFYLLRKQNHIKITHVFKTILFFRSSNLL